MKYVSAFIKLLLFFAVLVFLFLLAPLLSNAVTLESQLQFRVSNYYLNYSEPYIYYNASYQQLDFLDGEIPSFSEQMPPYYGYWGFSNTWTGNSDYNGMYYRMLVKTNSDIEYYNAPEELYIPIRLPMSNDIEEDYTIISFRVYSACSYDISQEVCNEVGILRPGMLTAELGSRIFTNNGKFTFEGSNACTVTTNDSFNEAMINCVIPTDRTSDNSGEYRVLKLNLNSDVYRTFSPQGEDYYQDFYDIFVRDIFFYQGTNNSIHDVDVTTDKDIATAVLTTDNVSDVTQYCVELRTPAGSLISECQESNTFTFSGLSNGQYELGTYIYYSDGSQSMRVTELFDITDSVKPVLNFNIYMGGYDDKLYVDLCGSYGVAAKLQYYYYQLDGGEWIQSTTCTHDFDVDGYGYYDVKVYVEDALGNQSLVSGLATNFSDPTEENQDFMQWIIDSTDSFFNNVIEFFNKVLDPDTWFGVDDSYLNDWFSRMNMLFSEQFGFLAYPFTWILTFLQRLVEYQDTGHYVISWGDIKVPNFDANIISAGSFDLATLLENDVINTFHETYFIVVNGLIILSFLNYCLNKINSVLGSNDVREYDVSTASDVATFDQLSGYTNLRTSITSTHTKRRRVK
ncbi:TPA: hypothetical protein IAB29_01875 [Candidatus Ventrenecus stercoripullorum]|nr:hypothetical protein [Candidatus Ventrenecus stercoripullorum]